MRLFPAISCPPYISSNAYGFECGQTFPALREKRPNLGQLYETAHLRGKQMYTRMTRERNCANKFSPHYLMLPDLRQRS